MELEDVQNQATNQTTGLLVGNSDQNAPNDRKTDFFFSSAQHNNLVLPKQDEKLSKKDQKGGSTPSNMQMRSNKLVDKGHLLSRQSKAHTSSTLDAGTDLPQYDS